MSMKLLEVEPVIRLHSQDGVYLEIGTDPDFPDMVQIRTPNPVSVEYYGDIRLSLDVAQMRQFIAALTNVCDAIDTLTVKD